MDGAYHDIPLSRVDRRRLAASSGLVHYHAESLHSTAQQCLSTLWDSLRGRQVVLWLDNFYKRRFGVNPTMTDASLNATAVAVLINTPALGPFRGHPTLASILDRLPLVVSQVITADKELIAFVRGSQTGIDADAIRVPLDVTRGRCVGQKWRPLSLERAQVGNQKDLLRCLELVMDVRQHTQQVLPMLVDENIYYRVAKWMYSSTYQTVAIQEKMVNIPLMYGVWHAYKFTCLHVHRMFFSIFTFLDRGVLEDGEQMHCVQKLAYIERMVAALLLLADEFLPQIDAQIARLQVFQAGVQTRRAQNRRAARDDDAAEVDVMRSLFGTRMRGGEGVMLLSRLVFLKQLRLLMSDYCNALFGIGYNVRTCTWGGRRLASSAYAKRALHWSLCVLLRLSPEEAHRIKYIRTICLCLCLWTSWHDVSPGCIHVEESCEAMLSKVTKAMRRHGCRTEHEHFVDVYMMTPVAQTPQAHRGGIPQKVMEAIRNRLVDLQRHATTGAMDTYQDNTCSVAQRILYG